MRQSIIANTNSADFHTHRQEGENLASTADSVNCNVGDTAIDCRNLLQRRLNNTLYSPLKGPANSTTTNSTVGPRRKANQLTAISVND